eukprot:gene10381-13952_t
MRGVNADDPPEVIVKAVLDSPFTRMPLWRGSIDNIIGVVHAKDLLRALGMHDADDTTSLREQLAAFLKRNTHFAIVVDEYGDMQGMVTMQDILEDLLGDMSDEGDVNLSGVRKEADGSIVVDGGVSIRDLNRAMGWALPDSEATTIAGLVIHESRSIPDERQAFTFHGKRFTVLKRMKNRITRLRIRPALEAVGSEDTPVQTIVAKLRQAAAATGATEIREAFVSDPGRFETYHAWFEDLLMDYSKTAVNGEVFALLAELAAAAGVAAKREAMFK